ncbi:SusC/RagA family TonB-linked outer membrane protein [Runella sp. CRIBMP]|uniref:SusC/RagA family TonB-linked outer membrane protein n=1 Tax=Runella sp. CRIBMP TaxID=2683261 RepID=UPI001412B4B3|nr:SusC/RagA family TonB-linked outer membrane protein [Runella sp. CRIBMP]NBB21877.1 SusC/RagA family TonB-linked outer membrane protein [Runella sp. CRIBMP]
MKKSNTARHWAVKIMQWSFIHLCIALIFANLSFADDAAAQEVLERRISIQVTNQNINSVLSEIEKIAEVKFSYSPNLIRASRKITVTASNEKLSAVLEKLLTPQKLSYEIVGRQIILKRGISEKTQTGQLELPNAFPQMLDQIITGTVTDESGSGLPGVSILVKGTQRGTTTDAGGKYKIDVPDGSAVLVFSFVGYLSQEVAVGNQSQLNLSLKVDTKTLDEVVVTAFGIKRDQKALGYASQKVAGEHISAVGNTNIQNSLQGKAAGVQVRLSSGMPGRPALVNIRGSRSITGSNEPLYVIDGLPVAAGGRSIDFNPADVESMDILKGPAAAALYGVRASNGVIVITTKSGKNANRKPTVTFESQFAQDKVSFLPKLQYEYAQGNNGVFDQNGLFAYGPKISTLGTYTNLLGQQEQAASYRNMEEFYGTGSTFNNNLEIAQGGSFGNYAIGVGRTDQTGVIANTGLQRTNIKFNGLLTPFSKFKVGVSINYADINVNDFPDEVGNAAFFRTVYETPPSYNLKGKPYAEATDPYRQILFRAAQNNPYWIVENNFRNSRTARTYGNLFLEYQLAKGLKVTYRVGLDNFNTKIETYDELGTGPTGRTNPPSGGKFLLQNQQETQLNSNLFLSYDRNLTKDLVLNVIAGNELFDIRRTNNSTNSANLVVGDWPNIANGTTITANNSNNAQRVVGFYGNANLGYKEMLYLNLSARQDYASNLPSGKRSFLYPSAGLSFVLTEAVPSLQNLFTFAKLRANYAEVGQLGQLFVNGVGYSAANPGFQFPLNGVAGFLPSSTSISSTLRPENTRSVELGTELRFLKNRISVDYTYFRSLSDGQIFGIPLPPSTGFGSQVNNAGKMLSRGHEIMLRLTPLKNSDFHWDFNVNFSKYKTTVEELPSGLTRILLADAQSKVQLVAEKGQVYPSFYGRPYQRDPASGQIVVSSTNGIPLQSPTLQILGTPNPDFEFNFINSFRFKSLTFGFQVDWRKGGLFYSQLQDESRVRGLSEATLDREIQQVIPGKKGRFVNGALVVEGDNDVAIYKTNTYWAALSANHESNLDDATFVRLREISLNYDLPAAITKKIGMSRASLFLTGRNLFLITNTFVDPELNMTTNFSGASTGNSVGIEWYQQPQTRSLGGGIRLKF